MKAVSENVTFRRVSSDTSKARMVTFRSGDERVTGFLAATRNRGRHRAIIAIHEWWGLNAWVKDQATNLAAHAFVVLAVDLYRGKVTTDPSEARTLKRDLPHQRAIRDLQAAFDYLARRPDVDPEHIGSLGWSTGGGFALQLAIHEPRLAACVVNYGSLPTDDAGIQEIRARVLGIFGSLDRGIPPGKVRAFETRMQKAKKSVDIRIYNDAGHAFENPANKRGYRPEAAADAWFHTLAFFDQGKDSKPPG
ncbi:MAG TPA: dienelactone hydrolase family protein [Caulobacteraceae bacterium]